MANIVSKERYEAAGEAWLKARTRMDAARQESLDAETALRDAETALIQQEAAAGIPAYWHDQQVTAEHCRIGSRCRVHGDESRGEW